VCAAIEQVARKPTQRKCWRVASSKQHCTCAHEIVYDRAVEFRDELFLKPAAVGRCKPRLIDVYLDCDRHAREGARVVSAFQFGIHPVRLLPDMVRPALDNGVDLRIDSVESSERRLGHFTGRHLAPSYETSNLACRQAPKFVHRVCSSRKCKDVVQRNSKKASGMPKKCES